MAFSQLKIFFVGKNRGRKWQQRKPESQHPQRDLDGEIHHRNLWIPVPTPHLRKKNTTEKIPSIKAVYFTVWEMKKYPKFHKKKQA